MMKLGILVSGSGSNLQAIIDAITHGQLDAEIALVLSNVEGAFALERAKKAGIPAVAIPHQSFKSREDFDSAVVQALKDAGVEWVILAGFMRIITKPFLDAFPWRIVNIHPALLPSFPGAHGIRDALNYGVAVTGCTVHLVDAGVDSGPILAQQTVAVKEDDSEASLAERMHRAEHQLYISTLQKISTLGFQIEEPALGRAKVRWGQPCASLSSSAPLPIGES